MLYQGDNITVADIGNGILEFIFNAKGSVNKFDQLTFIEFKKALTIIKNYSNAQGLLITSTKKDFLVGADINEFLDVFSIPENELVRWIKKATDHFNELEDLNIPTVAAVNGFALGGGCEFIISCDYRIAESAALIGLPEVKLGIMPGFGGTVRLPRLIGIDNAVEWIATAAPYKAEAAFNVGVIDGIAQLDDLREAALTTLKQAIEGKLNWQHKRQQKLKPLPISAIEQVMSFSTCKAMVMTKAGKHYPAPLMAINTIEQASQFPRAEAMAIENKNFAVLAKTPEATAQVGLFLADQFIKSKAKKAVKNVKVNVKQASVLGAGIMGGGIAYQSAYKNIPIVMKDINAKALDLGVLTATNLLLKQQQRGKIDALKMAQVLTKISPTLSYETLKDSDIVIEAVIENEKVKAAVLVEVEKQVQETAILTSNTSTISINVLAKNLSRKDKFCGMHFFNPVYKMPLVEVIKGKHTSKSTIASVVAYATAIGKSAIVVNDCPGFYVNRVLFPYLAAFSKLLLAGADYLLVDKVMENEFGWPMGPALLLDVVGIDTAYHCTEVMAAGYPTRMGKIENDPVELLFHQELFGQKSASGFYEHYEDKKGKPYTEVSAKAKELIYRQRQANVEFSHDEIINLLMIPMINEVVKCLEEGVIASAFEADMGLIYGLGFPAFRGGPIRYLETMGIQQYIQLADELAHLGELYCVSDKMREMAKTGKSYFTEFAN